jgi:hypothetical protein
MQGLRYSMELAGLEPATPGCDPGGRSFDVSLTTTI